MTGAAGREGGVHKLHSGEPNLSVHKRALLEISRELHSRGWVANHDGNVTQRLHGGRWLATPTALSKRVLTDNDLIVVDRSGRVLQGGRQPFSEFKLHLAVYDARPDAMAVVHAHPPAATALSLLGQEVDPRIIAEAVVSLGDRVPLLPYGFPNGADQLAELRALAASFDVVVLENHGLLSWGDDLEQAFLRAELVEHLANILLRALQVGSPRRVPEADVVRLLEKRTAAGLGPEARRRQGRAR